MGARFRAAELSVVSTAAVEICLFFGTSVIVHPSVIVTSVVDEDPVRVLTEVTSVMGTNDEQKEEALIAIRTALHASTSPRRSSDGGMLAAYAMLRRNRRALKGRIIAGVEVWHPGERDCPCICRQSAAILP